MSTTIDAVFDGEVLRPQQPLQLPPNTKVRITIETSVPKAKPKSFLQTAKSLKIDGPADWSERIEEYLDDAPSNGQ